jgi:hypothetical protein
LAIAIVLPLLAMVLPESPAAIGLPAYGAAAVALVREMAAPGDSPFSVAIGALARASGSPDFWLLCLTFGICGFSTNGLINTHLIAYCADYGTPEVHGARSSP